MKLNPINTGFKKKSSVLFDDTKNLACFKEIIWNHVQQESRIELDVEVPINEIPTSSLQFCLWLVNLGEKEDLSPTKKGKSKKATTFITKNTTEENNNSHSDIDHDLICETHISLN